MNIVIMTSEFNNKNSKENREENWLIELNRICLQILNLLICKEFNCSDRITKLNPSFLNIRIQVNSKAPSRWTYEHSSIDPVNCNLVITIVEIRVLHSHKIITHKSQLLL